MTDMTSRARSALVVSADPAVRADWARHFEALGIHAIRCVGPQVECALIDRDHCPLHGDADLAVYDRASVTPEFIRKLANTSHTFPLALANDRLDADGRHEPAITTVFAPAAAQLGSIT